MKRIALVAAVVPLLLTGRSASAAFPGANGKIAFESLRSIAGGDPSTTDREIFTMNPNGTGLTQLTVNSFEDNGPRWSPDGTQIVFSRYNGIQRDVYVMDAAGGNQRQLTNNPAFDANPSWSPNGRRIVFVSDRHGSDDLYAMDVADRNNDGNGDHLVRLTKNAGLDADPAWSPNGRQIAFTSSRSHAVDQVFVMKAAPEGPKNRPRDITQQPSFAAGEPNWSPDGHKLAFETDRGVTTSDGEVWVMNANGTGATALTENVATDGTPAWSPDGTKITFYSTRNGGNADIFTMNADGSAPTPLTNDAAIDVAPDWQRI